MDEQKGATTGSSGEGPFQNFHWPPILDITFNGDGGSVTLQIEMYFYVFFEKSIISRFPFQL